MNLILLIDRCEQERQKANDLGRRAEKKNPIEHAYFEVGYQTGYATALQQVLAVLHGDSIESIQVIEP